MKEDIKEEFDKRSHLVGFTDIKKYSRFIIIETCKWSLEDVYDEPHYSTMCDEVFYFIEGKIELNGFKFCPYCGKPIEEVKDESV